jgi:LmbE family N-acetylglucosaminyl deacetylase
MRALRRFPSTAAILAASIIWLPAVVPAQSARILVAAFAHPDDERVIGPLLSRLSREGWELHLVIATDGSKGIRDHAGIPAGPALAAARTKEAQCAADRLGVKHLHLLGLEDGGLASFTALGRLRSQIADLLTRIRPAVVMTFGPEGGTGHPDHRLIGNVVSQVVQNDSLHRTIDLLYATLPTERLNTAPPSTPRVNGVAESLLPVRVPFESRDLVAGRESFACHRTQYTPTEMDAINSTLAHVWNGHAWLRPWNGPMRSPEIFRR